MKKMIMDGNSAVAYISYAFSEIALIYPITPASPMAELADEWAANGKINLFGQVVKVVQMQSEGGAAGALHGALTCGALATTYTCSQGLLLMIPDMYKIAGELLPTVFHVSARAISTHALSIFGDHQDVMACRQTGFAMLVSASVQEAMDMAIVAHLATLKSSIPFLHFFDGFRTSHEMTDIFGLEEGELQTLIDEEDLQRFRARALTPASPMQRGTAQNPDIYFQNREACNPYYLSLPDCVQATMHKLAAVTGRAYRLFDYYGDERAEHVLTLMGSAAITAEQVVQEMIKSKQKVGVIKVRLYRPFSTAAFIQVLPPSCKTLTVLDRTKESGALGEPLYLDICAALQEKEYTHVHVYGGRYGLGGKDFTPSDCYAVFKNAMRKSPKNHFTVGICDDVCHTSLDNSIPYPLPTDYIACKFYGLGSDGTVGANKNSVQVIGKHTNLHVQSYFCYDSRKSGGATISHLRFGQTPIQAPYLIDTADFIACHNPSYVKRYDMLSDLKKGGVFLLNCPWTEEKSLDDNLPAEVKRLLWDKQAKLYVIDARKIAEEVGLKGRISTVMQAAFFYLHPHLLPYTQAKELLIQEIQRKFQTKGGGMVEMNTLCIEKAEENIHTIPLPKTWKNAQMNTSAPPPCKGEYFDQFMKPILTLQGDSLPVSAFSADGSVPTDTAKLEKHGAPPSLPKWIPENCIQCNQCAFVCPHGCIRPFVFSNGEDFPESFIMRKANGEENALYRIQVSPYDCMGCGVCAHTCPAPKKALVMSPTPPLLAVEEKNWEFAHIRKQLPLPAFKRNSVKGSQFFSPLFEFSYACSGCGETPYIKVLTQLFGERLLIANATGCSSIYGGSAPSCPYAKNEVGQGPAWASSLFEDNAEFGYGMRLALETRQQAENSVWIVGGDGWAYDIGFGGLDHILSTNANVNVLVLDSEVYSNTGGQTSKATPMGAIARFSALGKQRAKKNLGLMAMSYGTAYVAQVSMGANMNQLVNALAEAEAYDGPALIIAYSPCIAHGVYLGECMEEEKLAVESGYWHLYRFNPALREKGENPFTLDSKPPSTNFQSFLSRENRFTRLQKQNPALAQTLFARAEKESKQRIRLYENLREFFENERIK